jgi:hypothetical protein
MVMAAPARWWLGRRADSSGRSSGARGTGLVKEVLERELNVQVAWTAMEVAVELACEQRKVELLFIGTQGGKERFGHGSSWGGSRVAASPAGRASWGGQQRCPTAWPPGAGGLAGQKDCEG